MITMNRSAIINLESAATDDSDYEMDVSSDPSDDRIEEIDKSHSSDTFNSKDSTGVDDLRGDISKGVATYVWQEGQQRARKAFSLYANIDILRPYYDVEPREVRDRLISSLIPKLQGPPLKIPRELYGPTMMVLTLIALLLFQMKSYKVTLREGTLMGSAFVTCFGYWLGITGFLWLVAFVCNTRVTGVQLLNLLGYALFGHCIVLSLTVVFHPNHSHLFFYIVWIIFGGLSSLRMASLLMSRTNGKTQKMVISGVVIFFHLFFLFYLHFAYHHVIEDLSEAFGGVDESHSVISNIVAAKDMPENVPKGLPVHVDEASQITVKAVTKFVKRTLRKGLPGGIVRNDQIQPAVNKVIE